MSGHVDGLGKVVALTRDARSWRVTIEALAGLAKYIAQKGSICIDGTSLTVNSVDGPRFDLNIIPQTWEETVFSKYAVVPRLISKWILLHAIWSVCSNQVLCQRAMALL